MHCAWRLKLDLEVYALACGFRVYDVIYLYTEKRRTSANLYYKFSLYM